MMHQRVETPSTTPTWEENYNLLREHLESKGELNQGVKECWLVGPPGMVLPLGLI